MTGQISTTTAHYFEEADRVAISLHYPYAEASWGPGAALGSVLAFNQSNLAFLSYAMIPGLLVLGTIRRR